MLLLLNPLIPGAVVPVKIPYMGQIELFNHLLELEVIYVKYLRQIAILEPI